MGLSIGIMGFGEAGRECARTFTEIGQAVVVYDALLERNPEIIHKRAAEIGVTVASSVEDFLTRVDHVFIFTPGATGEAVAYSCRAFLAPNQLYIDCNSAAPEDKQKAFLALDEHPLFVDAAVMAAVPGLGHRVPMVASGPGAQRFHEVFSPFGMSIDPMGGDPGAAAIVKLVRSTFMKGIAALLLETLALSETYQVTAKVMESLQQSIGAGFPQLAARLASSTFQHAERRFHEVEAVRELFVEQGLAHWMTDATAMVHQQAAAYGRAERDDPGFLAYESHSRGLYTRIP